eukprot:CAMPEP_0204641698 /NCGR_PEP_ID=MMETSP0717-20131115/51279_1 /ASSEMBLY_ACC=CAM_ASM_000666 /TAXON_ID=230516 /ORGANISM="Chaetoceros curvisetus" /LENGTH=106 /DNA_ID=CAMNT_0051662393 /DNA_START=295 /DNA_END=615 /DNA_ORIENTATION=+
MMDYTESVYIEYDPDEIEFGDLLAEWARMHTPTRRSSRQYRSAIFYGDEDQKHTAEDCLNYLSQKYGHHKVYVDIEPWTKFYKAEEYHQDYLRKHGMGGELVTADD